MHERECREHQRRNGGVGPQARAQRCVAMCGTGASGCSSPSPWRGDTSSGTSGATVTGQASTRRACARGCPSKRRLNGGISSVRTDGGARNTW